jgi:uncharacterized metal-binding protein
MAECCASKTVESTSCCSSSGPRLVLSCSGGSNVGQIANTVAMELDKQGKGQMYCLIGVAAHIGGMVDSAKNASGIIAIDGCQVACAKAALDHLQIPITQHIVVTDLEIKKNHVFEWTDDQLEKVVSAVRDPANS